MLLQNICDDESGGQRQVALDAHGRRSLHWHDHHPLGLTLVVLFSMSRLSGYLHRTGKLIRDNASRSTQTPHILRAAY